MFSSALLAVHSVLIVHICTCTHFYTQSSVPKPLGDLLPQSDNRYGMFSYRNKVYKLGTDVLLPSDTFNFPVSKTSKKAPKNNGSTEAVAHDEVKYPELYRKSEYIKGSNLDVPKPFQIGS